MPPMPGSISRGRFLRAIQDIANNRTLEDLIAIRETLVQGAQHVDNLRQLTNKLNSSDREHLARHWFSEAIDGNQPAAGDRWWMDEATSEIIRYGEIRGLDLLIEAQTAKKKTYTDCVWICRGETVEVVNTTSMVGDTMFLMFMVLTPPIPRAQQIADATRNYSVREGIWVTTARDHVTYDGRLLPGFSQDGKEPPSEATSRVITVEHMTVPDDDPGWTP